jgi:hypothetical protein
MTRRQKAKRKPTSTVRKDALPRGCLKTKQTRVDKASRMSPPGPQQTKLSFAIATTSTTTVLSPMPKTQSNETNAAITPEPGKAARLSAHDKVSFSSNTTSDTQQKTNKKPPKIQTKKITYLDDTMQESDDAKPAAKTSKKKAPKIKMKYKEIRYRGVIETPPSDKPFEDFVQLLKKYVMTVQNVLRKNIFLAPWDSEQEATFPHLKIPADVLVSRKLLGIYLGTYINPKQEGSKIFMNL